MLIQRSRSIIIENFEYIVFIARATTNVNNIKFLVRILLSQINCSQNK